MKKIFLCFLCIVTSVLADFESSVPLKKLTARLNEVEEALKICEKELELGYVAQQYAKDRLKLDRDIIMLMLKNYKDFLYMENLEKKIDYLLQNLQSEYVRDCFAQQFEERSEMKRKIEEELQPMEHYSQKRIRENVEESLFSLRTRMESSDLKLFETLRQAMGSGEKFKCPTIQRLL